MRASLPMITISAQSAMSEPPATAKPWTLQITGFGARKTSMNKSVFRFMKR